MRWNSRSWVRRLRLLALAAGLSVAATPAICEEIVVLCSISLKQWVESARSDFERASGLTVKADYLAVALLKKRIQDGERFDLAILLREAIVDLAPSGLIVAPRDEARTAMGVAVRTGSRTPDLSTADAVRGMLQAATKMSYSRDSASGQYFVSLFDRLGIAEAKAKLIEVPNGAVEAVGRGDADLTIITIPNIVGRHSVELAGKLPVELQNYTVFTSGLAPSAGKGAAQFREFLAGRRRELQRFGLEPPGS